MTAQNKITDHALVRWAERVENIDTSDIRKITTPLYGPRPGADRLILELLEMDGHDLSSMRERILSPAVREALKQRHGGVELAGGQYLLIRGGKIVTVFEHGMNYRKD